MKRVLYAALLAAVLLSCSPKLSVRRPVYDYSKMDKKTAQVHKKIERVLTQCVLERKPVALTRDVRIDSLRLDEKKRTIKAWLGKSFSYPAYRSETVAALYSDVRKQLGKKYNTYQVTLYTLRKPLEELVPNWCRADSATWDRSRMPLATPRPAPLIRRISRPLQPGKGLHGRTIDVRPSHGWYYNSGSDRWEWQRPRLFETVEDLLPFTFTIPYLIPMLENAGAVVFTPRERDTQIHEVVVDNDAPSGTNAHYAETSDAQAATWENGVHPGFALGHPPYAVNHNPFRQGTFRQIFSQPSASAEISWTPDIPADGAYAVYVSWGDVPGAVEDAHYTVHHAGGQSRFLANQQIGASTWIYLGTFDFKAGLNGDSGRVVLSNASATPGRIVSADAVRFGGGMGNILRNGAVSGRPRFAEGSKYYLQYAGLPDTLIYNLYNNKDDYKDDYNSRSEYVNYLYGAPFGPKKNRHIKGLGIPFDLSLAFHTDAGITRNDTTVGTLAIYSLEASDSTDFFPDGVSRMANRDFADLMQTQVVDDIRRLYDPAWNRRFVMDGQYSEAVRPNVPTMLIELLSHQNFLDMKFALDPRFRFDVARSMYKAMLKFIAFQHRADYVVQPLPVEHFQAQFSAPRQVTLKWQPRRDPLEPGATPGGYIVYTRRETGGFDDGIYVREPQWRADALQPGVIYSFRVSAVNEGGESFPSETLAVCWMDTVLAPVLIINGFDRICAPATIDGENFSGFADFIDPGVADHYTINYAGRQIDFSPPSPFRSNDAPGHGASMASHESVRIAGNTFDFAIVHGQSIRAAGHPFVTCSDEAVMAGEVDAQPYRLIDLLLGEEKETRWPAVRMDSLRGLPFKTVPAALQKVLGDFLKKGGGLFISGSYIGSDLAAGKKPGHEDVQFIEQQLRYKWSADHACSDGRVYSVDSAFWPKFTPFVFNTALRPDIYAAEAPDAIDPVNGSRTILRYSENQYSAAVAYKRQYAVVALGFPFETLVDRDSRDQIMRASLRYLGSREKEQKL